MPRTNRIAPGGWVFHVLNRANARMQIFHKDADYQAFENILDSTLLRFNMRLLSYCIMPILTPWPVDRPRGWTWFINEPQTMVELVAIREAAKRGRPFGSPAWQGMAAKRLGLESTMRLRGRPRKT